MNQPITYEDACSKCGQACSRVKRPLQNPLLVGRVLLAPPTNSRFVTSCCGAAPVAKAVS